MDRILNLSGLDRYKKESTEFDSRATKETSKSKLRGNSRYADQFARNMINREAGLLNDSDGIDPFDATPSSKKNTKLDIFKLSNAKYQTSLLEGILRNQTNKSFNESVLTYQSKVLEYLDGIHSKLDTLVASKEISEDEIERKEYSRKVSTLAEATATGNLDEIFNQMKSTILNNANLSGGPLGMILSFLPMIKSMFGEGQGKELVQNAAMMAVSKLNPKFGDYLKRYKEDAAGFFQDMLDQFAVSDNATIAKLFKPFATRSNILMQDEKFDPSKLAKFDNKVYMSITKIMPEQLIKQTDLLEAMVTGESITPRVYDWETNDYTDLTTSLEKQNEDRRTVTTESKTLTNTLIEKFADKIEDDDTLKRKYASILNLDKDGSLQYDADRNLAIKNKESLQEAVASILQSGANGVEQLRNPNTNIDEYISLNKLDKRLVNGKLESISDQELATRRQMYKVIQDMLQTYNEDEKTEITKAFEASKSDITNTSKMNYGAWASLKMSNLYDQVLNGTISPDEYLSKIRVNPVGPGSGGGGSGTVNQQTNQQPKLYKNAKGNMVKFEELSDTEKAALRIKTFTENSDIYGYEGSETSKLNYQGPTSTLSDNERLLIGLLSNGLIDNEQYNYYSTNLDNPDVLDDLKKYKVKFDAASKLYNQLSKAGLTAASILTNNKDMDPRILRNKGYFNSPGEVYRFINDDGKVNSTELKTRFGDMYSDENLAKIQKIDIKNLGSSQSMVNSDNPVDSTADFLTTLFSDPTIAKKAGIAAGGVAGYGLSKALQMMGKRPGVITKSLPVVLASLMATESAQRWAQNIFGPEGQIKGASGFSNREIFISKMVTRWLPTLGLSVAATRTTQKLMNLLGPMGYLMGLPVSLATGALMAVVGPSIMSTIQDKMFGEEARQKGTMLSKVGSFISQTFPWVTKYLGGGNANERMQYLQTYELSRQKFRDLFKKTKDELAKETNPDEKAKLQEKLRVYVEADKIFTDAIKSVKSIKDMEQSEESMILYDIKRTTDEKMNKLEESSKKIGQEANQFYKDTYDKVQADSSFNAGLASKAKYTTTNDIIKTAYEGLQDGSIDSSTVNVKTASILEDAYDRIQSGKKLDMHTLFTESNVSDDLANNIKEIKQFMEEYKRDVLTGKAKTVEDILSYDEFKSLNEILDSEDPDKDVKFVEEFNRIIDNLKNNGDEAGKEDAEILRKIISYRMQLRSYQSEYLESIVNTLKVLYPGMKEKDILNHASKILKDTTAKNPIDEFTGKVDDTIAKAQNIYNSAMADGLDSDMVQSNQDTIDRWSQAYSDRLYKPLDDYYGGATADPTSAFQESYSGNERTTMKSLKNKRFKTGSDLSITGCSIAAFNNMLTTLGMSKVDPDALIPIANNFVNDKGVSPQFFIQAAIKLNIDPLVYNGNNISDTSIRTLQPMQNSKGMIALLYNEDNSSHYVTILSIRGDMVTYDDPNLDKPITTTMSTFKARLSLLLIFNKMKVSTSMQEMFTNFKNSVKENITRERVSNIVNRGIETAERLGSTATNILRRNVVQPTIGIAKYMANTKPGYAIADKFNSIRNTIANVVNPGTNPNNSELTSLLNKIYLSISGMRNDMTERAEHPTEVSILDDQTIPLQETDERKARAINRHMEANTPNAEEARDNVRQTLETPEVRNESQQAEAVQQKILEDEQEKAGTKVNTANGTKVEDVADSVGEDSPSKPRGIKAFIGSLVGKLGFLTGASLTALPSLALWKNGGRYATALPGQALGLLKGSEDAEYDPDTGAKVSEGHYRDFSGFARNFRNVKNGLFAATTMTTNIVGSMVAGGGTRLANYGAKIAENGGKIAGYAGRIAQKFGGTVAAGADLVTKFITSVSDFLYKTMDRLSKAITKIPFLKRYADRIMAKLATSIPRLIAKLPVVGKKILEMASKNVTEGTAKSIPGINIAVFVGLAIAAIWNALRHPDLVLDIPKETVTFGLRIVALAAKCVWDVLPMIISAVCGLLIPGSSLAVDAIIGALQMFFGFNNFLKLFGLDEEWREKKRLELVEQKQAEKEIDDKLKDADKQEEQTDKKEKLMFGNPKDDISKDTDKRADTQRTTKDINDESGLSIKIDPNIKVGNTTDYNQKVLSEEKIAYNVRKANYGENSLSALFNAQSYNRAENLTKEQVEERRKQIMESPEMKAKMALWEGANKEGLYHPLGDSGTRITSTFGPRNVVGASKNHKGVDFSTHGKSGEPIRASKAGKVILSSKNYGQIILEHPDGSRTKYMHLSERFPEVGAEVSAGDIIGTSGGVGRGGAHSYIPHLHYEYIDPQGNNVDPFLKLGLDPKVINTAPAANNKENIAYLERNPFLLEQDKTVEEAMKNQKLKDAKNQTKEKEESIKTKAAGGPTPQDERQIQAELKAQRTNASAPKRTIDNQSSGGQSATAAMIQVLSVLSSSVASQQQSLDNINATLNMILQYLQSNINNDMLESSMIAKMS